MVDWNHNGKKDAFDIAVDLMILDELEQEEKSEETADLDYDLMGSGYDSFDLEMMDEDRRNDILWDNGLDPDDYDF